MSPLNDLEASSVRERARTGALNYAVGLVIAGGILIDQTWSLVVAVVVSLLASRAHCELVVAVLRDQHAGAARCLST